MFIKVFSIFEESLDCEGRVTHSYLNLIQTIKFIFFQANLETVDAASPSILYLSADNFYKPADHQDASYGASSELHGSRYRRSAEVSTTDIEVDIADDLLLSPLDQGTTGEWEVEGGGDELFEDGAEVDSMEAQETQEESERKMRRINELLKMIGRNFI